MRAFTLLEVLVAVGVFAFAALGLLGALESALDGARATQQQSMVREGLSNRLASLSVGSLRPLQNDDTENGVAYHEKVDREEVQNADGVILRGFWRISVKADWSDSRGPQSWTVSHLVYRNDG
ncbi:MAG TPA: type II secretion system protein [Chthoniobacterales bacterium]